MNPLNWNPKTLHILLEIYQGLSVITTVASLPGLSAVVPWIGVAGGVSAGLATIIKTQVIGNIPASTTPPAA